MNTSLLQHHHGDASQRNAQSGSDLLSTELCTFFMRSHLLLYGVFVVAAVARRLLYRSTGRRCYTKHLLHLRRRVENKFSFASIVVGAVLSVWPIYLVGLNGRYVKLLAFVQAALLYFPFYFTPQLQRHWCQQHTRTVAAVHSEWLASSDGCI